MSDVAYSNDTGARQCAPISTHKLPLRWRRIVQAVSVWTGVDEATIMGRSRRGRHVAARWLCWQMIRKLKSPLTGEPPSYPSIAQRWGVDHTSVQNACKPEMRERHKASRNARDQAIRLRKAA